jgi:hypothetical protein
LARLVREALGNSLGKPEAQCGFFAAQHDLARGIGDLPASTVAASATMRALGWTS